MKYSLYMAGVCVIVLVAIPVMLVINILCAFSNTYDDVVEIASHRIKAGEV